LTFEEALRRALGAKAPELTPRLVERLERLDELLVRWSAKIDLVGFATPEERVRRYFAEPLAAVSRLPSPLESALDIGSGGGSPALPLALWAEDCRFCLVESRRKKGLFLEEAARALHLETVRVRTERFEGAEGEAFDLVTTRGVRLDRAALVRIVGRLRPGGRFLWFSSGARLREGALALRRATGIEAPPPEPLLSGFPASLLVVEAPGEEEPRHGCFT
jgi:16S rRNA (guanine527-N7)-methyltransferase